MEPQRALRNHVFLWERTIEIGRQIRVGFPIMRAAAIRLFCLLLRSCSMDQLRKQVAKARRRLIVGQFLGALVWCWFATLLIAMAAIGVEKWLLVDVDGWRWAGMWLAGAVGAG